MRLRNAATETRAKGVPRGGQVFCCYRVLLRGRAPEGSLQARKLRVG